MWSTLPQATTGVCPKKLPFQQEEITIKVYENIEGDQNVKVYVIFGMHGGMWGGGEGGICGHPNALLVP